MPETIRFFARDIPTVLRAAADWLERRGYGPNVARAMQYFRPQGGPDALVEFWVWIWPAPDGTPTPGRVRIDAALVRPAEGSV